MFSDYMRNAIDYSVNECAVLYQFTHDSVFLGDMAQHINRLSI